MAPIVEVKPAAEFEQDPGEDVPYTLDWSALLSRVSASITGVSAEAIPPGPSIHDVTNDATTSTFWATTGVAGRVYRVVTTVTLSGTPTGTEKATLLVAFKHR